MLLTTNCSSISRTMAGARARGDSLDADEDQRNAFWASLRSRGLSFASLATFMSVQGIRP